jgi:hypothetical protein
MNTNEHVTPPGNLNPPPMPAPSGAMPPDEFRPLEQPASLMRIVDALLKQPARLVYETRHGGTPYLAASLLLVACLCMLAYGLIVGSFSGGQQFWFVPLKLLAGTVLASLICLPSLYIFTCLSGGRLTLRETVCVFLLAQTLTAVLLIGFAPVAWIFSQTTGTVVFMGCLHLAFWIAAVALGLQLFAKAFRLLNRTRPGLFRVWAIIYIVVGIQMMTALRPLVGAFDGVTLRGKKSFVTHWSDSLEGTCELRGRSHR